MRPFARTLSELQRGIVADDAATALAEVTKAVQEVGKKGKVTLTITVSPYKGNPDIVNVSGQVKADIPVADPPASVFYPDPDGNLSRSDPNALALFPEREAHQEATR